jgi:hypothetical protein
VIPPLQPRPPDDTTTVSRAINVMVELAEIGRVIELCPQAWAWPTAQRVFRVQTELRGIVAEAFR